MITREIFRRLLDTYANAVADVAIRKERNRPDRDQLQAEHAAVNARNALEAEVFAP